MENVHDLSARNVRLAEEYRLYATELGKLKRSHGVRWLEMRKECNTDKETDMRFSATEEGQRETQLTYLLKGLEKEMSAIKAHLRVLDVFGN
jgi:hypothetical protein